MGVPVDTIEVAGQTVEIEVSKTGYFAMRLAGSDESKPLGAGSTLAEAMTQTRTALAKRKVKVEVPFIVRSSGEEGVATSRHAGHGQLLTSLGQYDPYRLKVFKADIPRETLDRYLRLADEIAEREAERRTIDEEWGFDVTKAVDAAVDEKMSEAVPA